MKRKLLLILATMLGIVLSAWFCAAEEQFFLQSRAFEKGATIPVQFTCDGRDISPPLSWTAPPAGTKSLALVCDDPDAPMGTWVHWVYYNLPPDTRKLKKGIATDPRPAPGGTQGVNDFHKAGYGGPCPPGGVHRYFFTLYALDTAPKLSPGFTKKELLNAIDGHIIEKVQLMGRYGH